MSNTGTHSDYIHSPEGSAVLKDMHQWNSIQVLINNIQNSSNNNNIEKKEVSDEPF